MFAISNSVVNQYDAVLRSMMIPIYQFADYRKWLRYFLDFCAKYPSEVNDSSAQEQLFLEKLRQKNQSAEQRKQAEQAIKLYVGMQEQTGNEGAADKHSPAGGEVVRHCLLPDASSGQPPQAAAVQSGSSHYWGRLRGRCSFVC